LNNTTTANGMVWTSPPDHTPQPPVRGPRQVIRFTSIAEVFAVAQQLYAAGCTPRGVDRPEKLIPMLLTGAELGLGIMQSIKHVTPPVNGSCNLYGDMGLALVRQSGQLEQFDERIEGDGGDRKAVCVIKRRGYPARTFEYAFALAAKLKSYQVAQTKGGPWADDPDNMLMWRARWRALRTEFTDILNGLGGAEEQEEEQSITVEVVAPARPAAALQAVSAVPEETLKELSRLKKTYAEQIDPARVAAEWGEYLDGRGVKSARDLTAEQAEVMCEHFGRIVDPFGYPATSPAASPATEAAGPTPSPAS
jgi:hypothetical protein